MESSKKFDLLTKPFYSVFWIPITTENRYMNAAFSTNASCLMSFLIMYLFYQQLFHNLHSLDQIHQKPETCNVRMYSIYQIPQILFMNPRDNPLHAKKGYKQISNRQQLKKSKLIVQR